MSRRSSVFLLYTLTACDGVFGLTHVRTPTDAPDADAIDAAIDANDVMAPVQAVQGVSTAGNGTSSPLSLQLPSPSMPGNSLVLACAIATSNTHLSGITDDGATGPNVWTRVVDSVNWTTSPSVRVEIWHTTTGHSMTTATVQYGVPTDQRPLVCELIEWPMFANLEDTAVQPPSTNKVVNVSSSPVTTLRRSALVGIVATADPVDNVALVSPPFTSFGPGKTANGATVITSDVVWALQPPGPIEAKWMLMFGQHWDAGLAAFGLR